MSIYLPPHAITHAHTHISFYIFNFFFSLFLIHIHAHGVNIIYSPPTAHINIRAANSEQNKNQSVNLASHPITSTSHIIHKYPQYTILKQDAKLFCLFSVRVLCMRTRTSACSRTFISYYEEERHHLKRPKTMDTRTKKKSRIQYLL